MTPQQVGAMLLALAVIMVLARLLGALARWVGQPPVIGEIVAGILVGPTLFGTVVSNALFPTDIRPALAGLANIGLVLFMFIVGYELDHALVRGKERVAASVSIGSIILPFGLGATLAVWLAGNHGVERVLPFVLFMGAAMSVTAFPVLARILTDRTMLRTPVGGLALASAAVDDVAAWSLLAVVVTIGGGAAGQWHILFALPYVLLMFLVVRPLLRRLEVAREKAGRLTPGILAVILIGLLLSCYITEWMGVHFIFGAFLFGVVTPRSAALRHDVLERLEQVSVLLLLPVFFFLSGMRVDLSAVDLRGVLELVLILLVAIVGKFAGAYAGARLQGVRNRQAGALATLMNTRGLTEIVILTVGLQLGILNTHLFSLMVVMALVTTIMAGPLLSLIYPRRQVERDIAEAERSALEGAGAYRVLVVVGSDAATGGVVDSTAASSVALGADLVGSRRPAAVVLTRLISYQTSGRLEVGTGLSGGLLEITRTMDELDALASPLRTQGLTVPVRARMSDNPIRELLEQVADTVPDVLVIGADHPAYAQVREAFLGVLVIVATTPPVTWESVLVRLGGGGRTEAALQVAAQLAAARGVELVVDAGQRASRSVQDVVSELNRHGLPARLGSSATGLVVGVDADRTDGAHLVVRPEPARDPVEPAAWIPLLPRLPEAAMPAPATVPASDTDGVASTVQ
jgi:Kef-type K+ transport system membrane component KefB